MSVSPAPHQFVRAMPVLDCTDMARSIGFYRDTLGFHAATFGEPIGFVILQRGTVTLALASVLPGTAAVSRNWIAYLYVADVDALFAEFKAHGLTIDEGPEDKFYDCRDFTLSDPDGHKIAFGQVLSPDPLGPGLSLRTGRDKNSDRVKS